MFFGVRWWIRTSRGRYLWARTLLTLPLVGKVVQMSIMARFAAIFSILQRSGGGAETEYVRLVCSDGVYSNPADAEVVEDLAAVTGKAIISNDLTVDMQSGDYLTLADAAKAD